MSRIRKKGTMVAVAGAIAIGLIAPAGIAHADVAPQPGDVVGVGSDTVQYIVDFGSDGDTGGDLGYNAAGNVNRIVNFDATADANGRLAYASGGTAVLNPTIVFRAGTSPVQRPNGSGAGIKALTADSSGKINYIRMSRPPTAAEQTAATAATGVGSLRVIQLATDNLKVATAATTNAPALSAQELVSIYTCAITKWNALPGNSGGSANTIHPVYPQTSSGTYSSFIADLKAANGGVTPTIGSCATVSEEHDPYALYLADSPSSTPNPDAIAPFSEGRFNLFASGYFSDPSVAYPGGPGLVPAIKLETGGTPGDSNPTYLDNRPLFVVFRNSDYTSTTPFQSGSAKNWVNTLFAAPTGTPFFKGSAGAALIAAAGGVAAYADKGNGYSVG